METEQILEELLHHPSFAPHIVYTHTIPAREGRYVPLPVDLDSRLAGALQKKGISQLYSHQGAVWQAVRSRQDVMVLTPTASGKTLSYNLPVLQGLLEHPQERALYLFPTKALSQDQQAELNDLVAGGGDALPIKVCTYDGDTPESLRLAARDTGRIIISNPDMLHAGILPNHPKWIKFFSNLAYVVIDEAHTYRGVFGSHVANVIRRLLRICQFYKANPTFILCSATIGNPKDLAHTLIGRPVVLVDTNGAPTSEKRIVLYNPPLVDPVQGIRKSSILESRRWMVELLRRGVKTILFAHSRLKTEVAASYVREDLKNLYTDNYHIRVEPYRAGLLPRERREIERGLREGAIQGVVSTNALELGIDIGGLDAAVVAGFPGSFNSFWQQIGRSGRRGGVSLAVLVATSSPLDQFIMQYPQWFFSIPAEEGRLNPQNPYIFTDHVKCGAFELPFEEEELGQSPSVQGATDIVSVPSGKDPFGSDAIPVLDYLTEDGILRCTGTSPRRRWFWADRSYPAEGVSLRSSNADNVVIVDITGGRYQVIGEMDRPSAKELLFDNAVYIHRGNQYIVQKLDVEKRTCLVIESEVNYYTDGLVKRDIKVLSEDELYRFFQLPGRGIQMTQGSLEELAAGHGSPSSEGKEASPVRGSLSAEGSPGKNEGFSEKGPMLFQALLGDVLVRSQVTKYKKIRFHTHENVGYGDIVLPEEELHTRCLVILFPPDSEGARVLETLKDDEERGAVLRSCGTLLKKLAPIYLLCDSRDIGVSERVRDPHFRLPALYVFDHYPGGTGLSEALLDHLPDLFVAMAEVVARCPCKEGCPSCVGPDGYKEGSRQFLAAFQTGAL
ncbi:MAG TPA: DEAD/DEAH box helicase [Termitinemataceae bacterium]|nr:DEAD/DEAH box helicase [Termitinemataceae bacterium]HOM22597.1 DEAD/DEAH box helicase [Termitinemataceae bacterium]HPQ00047.1 DEAD/DEAH box helicase [Termitinemataceae bacterium]